MMKHFLLLALSLLLWTTPQPTHAQDEKSTLETEFAQTVTLMVNGKSVRITNAEGKSLEVYNLTGVKVSSTPIESEDAMIHLSLTKGCYILKVDKVVRKVSIR